MLLTRSHLPAVPSRTSASLMRPAHAMPGPCRMPGLPKPAPSAAHVSHIATRTRQPLRPSAASISVDNNEYVVGPVFARGSYGSLHRALHPDRPGHRLVAKRMLVGPGSRQGVGADDKMYTMRPADKIAQEIAVMQAVHSPLRPESSEVGTDEATLMMPYCDGDLEAIGRSGSGLSQQTRRDMLRSALAQTSASLAQMHEAHYLHLDVKPSNMFFSRFGEVHLGDYGLAHAFKPGEPLQMRRGSPAMMAPEALLGKSLTPQGETWSLFVSWLDLAVGSQNNAFVTEPSRRLSRWKARHGTQPFSNIVDADDGPFRTFMTDLFAWRAAHPGPLDPKHLSDDWDDPIGQTLHRAYAFDPEVTSMGWEHALAPRPQNRISVGEFSAKLRALQPANSRAEAGARRGFARLADANALSERQFAALRQEASQTHGGDNSGVRSGTAAPAWTAGSRRAVAI